MENEAPFPSNYCSLCNTHAPFTSFILDPFRMPSVCYFQIEKVVIHITNLAYGRDSRSFSKVRILCLTPGNQTPAVPSRIDLVFPHSGR